MNGERTWTVVVCLAAAGLAAGLAGCKSGRDQRTPVAARVIRDGGSAAPGEPVPAGTLLGDGFSVGIGVYHLPRPKTDPKTVLARLAPAHGFGIGEGDPENVPPTPTVWIEVAPAADYPPPDGELLEVAAQDLTRADLRDLAKSRSVTMLSFAGPATSALASYRQALAIADQLAAATGGLLWDQETRQVFSRKSWAPRLAGWHDGIPNLIDHIVIHDYRDGDLMRLVTLGMRKLALPDVAVEQVASESEQSMGHVLNDLCQTIAERPTLQRRGELTLSLDEIKHPAARADAALDLKKNAKRRAKIHLSAGKPQEGDTDNRLIEIAFPGPESERQVGQAALLSEVLGSEDAVAYIKQSAELQAASRRARARLLAKHKRRYLKGPPFREHLLVKAPFATADDGIEWMWVEVVRWKGHTIHGVLDNDPTEVPDLKAGARVEVEEDSLFDYLLTKPDGTQEGNETSRIIRQQEGSR